MAPISEGQNTAWCVVFGLESAAVIIGNILVIAAFVASSSMFKRKTYLLLISLAVADLLIGAVVIPMYIHLIGGQLTAWWEVDDNVSHTQKALEIFASYASIYFLVVIALERLYAVLSPFDHDSLKPVGYYIVIGFVWLLAAIMGIISFLREEHVDAADNDRVFYFLMVMLSLCMIIIIISYVVIAVNLLASERKFSDDFEKKMAATLLMLTVIFVVTWLPFKVINYIFFADPETKLECGDNNLACIYQTLYFTKFLHYFNSVVNPIVYALRVKDFREGVRRILCCFCKNPAPLSPPRGREKGLDNPAVSMQSIDTAVPSMFL